MKFMDMGRNLRKGSLDDDVLNYCVTFRSFQKAITPLDL